MPARRNENINISVDLVKFPRLASFVVETRFRLTFEREFSASLAGRTNIGHGASKPRTSRRGTVAGTVNEELFVHARPFATNSLRIGNKTFYAIFAFSFSFVSFPPSCFSRAFATATFVLARALKKVCVLFRVAEVSSLRPVAHNRRRCHSD